MATKARSAQQNGKQLSKDARALDRAAKLLSKTPSLPKTEALRQSGIAEARDIRRLSAHLSLPVRKAKPSLARTRKVSAPVAAAPLLAATPKKVSAVSKDKVSAKPTKHATYQPKTEVPPIAKSSARKVVPAVVAPDVFAIARPWINLGLQMTMQGFAMQARLAKTALAMPPAAMAYRHSSEALKSWLAFAGQTPNVKSGPAKD